MKQFFLILSLIRLHNLCLGAMAVIVATQLLGFSIDELVIKCMLIVISIMALGYIMNDFIDLKSDKINHPNRPLLTGEIPYINISLLVIILLIILFFSIKEIHINAILLLLYSEGGGCIQE